MEELLYWIMEYVKVLFGYGFVMFVWPSVVFRKYLRRKSVTFRFGFCATVPIVIFSTVVLMLGLMHILNRWTMRIFFYGLFIWSFRDKFKLTKQVKQKFKYLITGTFGWKHLLLLTWKTLVGYVKRTFSVFWKFYRIHWLEYTLLVVTVVYGMIYFSWGAFQENSYGFSDIVVHHEWIYGLAQGKAFSAGIYPEGMHCMVYALYALFDIRIYSGLLFIGCINVTLILLALYCLMKEIFRWRYSPIFVLIIFLTFNLVNMNLQTAMSRMQCALPQEFGFPALYLCGLYLIRSLKSNTHITWKEKVSKGCWDENLLLFCMSLAVTIIVHFYATIMAFFLCLGIAIIYIKRIFSKEHFLPLVTAAILGVLIAIFPMVTGVAMGVPLQGSLYWAMNVMKGDNASTEIQEESESQQIEENKSEEINNDVGGNDLVEIEGMEPQIQNQQIQQVSQPGLRERLSEFIKSKWTTFYNVFIGLYQAKFVKWIIRFNGLMFFMWLLYRVIAAIRYRIFKNEKIDRFCFDGYPMMIISSLIFVAAYGAPNLGLPSLIESSRTCTIGYSLVVMSCVMVIDFLFVMLNVFCTKFIMHGVSICVAAALVAVIYVTGNYHGYLYFALTRYSASVNVANDIMEDMKQYTYTIVSPTEELYQIIDDGRHEEILTMMEKQKNSIYTMPTEYVFIFIEKKPLLYVQPYYFKGPEWLARSIQTEEEYMTSEISEEAAQKEIYYGSLLSHSYTSLTGRTILESKMYMWCERFKELYPNELKTYYEDEYFICYYFRQNTHRLYNLSLR